MGGGGGGRIEGEGRVWGLLEGLDRFGLVGEEDALHSAAERDG